MKSKPNYLKSFQKREKASFATDAFASSITIGYLNNMITMRDLQQKNHNFC